MNPKTPESHNHQPPLDWLAFCYVADELEPDQRASFENRLLDDQDAREAVAQAVWQTQCLNKAIEASRPAGRVSLAPVNHLKKQFRWLVPVSTLATVAAVLAIVVFGSRQSAPPQLSSDELAEIWVNTLVSLDNDELEDIVSADFESIEMDDDNDAWLVAVVDEMAPEPAPNEPLPLPETDQGPLEQ
jgi:anti-sigma-K factor RskA